MTAVRGSDDRAVRFRLWVDGPNLVAEDWSPADMPGPAWWPHLSKAVEAENAGRPWLAEIYDPLAPDDAAYIRFGTDTDGMVLPIRMDLEEGK